MFFASFQGRILALLLVAISSLTAGEPAQPGPRECDNESAVKISQLFGLRHHLLMKQEEVPVLTKDIRETVIALQNLNNLMNYTLEIAEGLEMEIENMSTPELSTLELSQTCDTSIPRDCCQVRVLCAS